MYLLIKSLSYQFIILLQRNNTIRDKIYYFYTGYHYIIIWIKVINSKSSLLHFNITVLSFHMHISLLLATEKGASRESLESKESAADRRKEAHSIQSDDSGVVVDSATLRLSVGEKIKRLSQRLPEPENPPASSKSSSLPKNISCKISIFLINNVSKIYQYIDCLLPICTVHVYVTNYNS